ncbi:hypothetical protein HPDFL43_00019070 [Hoeflea phototrophica DFL-43]|jgi:hypothetical protein|uniref:Uncharacterized protein n=1 Tax=Hoeflea phototrophica (strain DSM 17068 / NCIMB 14078 / DFL-43) TaxID=411684 RepID=A0A094ZYU4_HOEPD|nr:hypothetical protein HPDFL43_00019070 [Hoeflea phototrophica DFL-43]
MEMTMPTRQWDIMHLDICADVASLTRDEAVVLNPSR